MAAITAKFIHINSPLTARFPSFNCIYYFNYKLSFDRVKIE